MYCTLSLYLLQFSRDHITFPSKYSSKCCVVHWLVWHCGPRAVSTISRVDLYSLYSRAGLDLIDTIGDPDIYRVRDWAFASGCDVFF